MESNVSSTNTGIDNDTQSAVEIVVVGSINLDVSVPVDHLAAPGETVLGGDALWSAGGKGANQAVAAARLGRRVAMVGAVGADAAGADLLAGLAKDSIDVSGVAVLDGVPSGLAMISVDAKAENSIVVSPGANARVSAEQLEQLIADGHGLASAALVMAQFEIPIPTLVALSHLASGRLLLNPAPAVDGTTEGLQELMSASSILVPNRGELATLVGQAESSTLDELVDQAKLALADSDGSGSVVVTLGGDGALVVAGTAVTQIPIVAVTTVDTTAAGDSFCGALADALVGGADVVEAATWASRCAAVTVTRRGAQDSLPTRSEVG